MGTSRRRASSCARSTEMPRGSPVAGSFWASTGFPKLIAARSFPAGAISFLASRRPAVAVAQAQRSAAPTTDAIDVLIVYLPLLRLRDEGAATYTVPPHDPTTPVRPA